MLRAKELEDTIYNLVQQGMTFTNMRKKLRIGKATLRALLLRASDRKEIEREYARQASLAYKRTVLPEKAARAKERMFFMGGEL